MKKLLSIALLCFAITAHGIVTGDSLKLFNVTSTGTTACVKWETENSCKFFEIMRSTDGVNYVSIERMPYKGAGKYMFVDYRPEAGFNYYKIKQTYDDGSTFEFWTAVTEIKVKEPKVRAGNKSVTVVLPHNGIWNMELVDRYGRCITCMDIQTSGTLFEVRAGKYLCRITSPGIVSETKIEVK